MLHTKTSFYELYHIAEKQSRGKNADSTALSGVAVFKQLRILFWQDSPLYYKKYPRLKIFSSNIFTKYKAAIKEWCQMVYDCLEKQETIIRQAGGPPAVLLKAHEGLGDIFLNMKVVPNTFKPPNGFKMIEIPGSKFFSILEQVSNSCKLKEILVTLF